MTATLDSNLLLAIPLAPLAGALLAGLFGKTIGRAGAHTVTILGVALAFGLSALTLYQVMGGAAYNATLYEWMRVPTQLGTLKFEIGFLIDSLSALMMCVVSFVSLMVHIYTIGYMRDDPGYQRFFSYISLFTFAMLMLVMSNNFLQLFFGWEAVGVVSYLLIGFWYTKPTAIYANMKAFIVNRVGDFGFILGIGLLFAYAGSLNYGDVFAQREALAALTFPGTPWGLLTVACICLFIGAMGKSAQFPLHVWLPDSMEGPTPISALIHAATMVTAGIFMVARVSPLFELTDSALSFVLIIGAITTLLMGLLGLVQNDIKRVVAYSTLSQLGYMTVALGVSAYPVAIFHLMTHAFFKALLFLAAGSVIIGMHHEQDMRYMGGLRKAMPITWLTSLIGSLALIGTPFFSGFYSKDSIIEAVKYSSIAGSGFAYFAVVASVFVTALYSFRMMFLVFYGKPRWHEAQHSADHSHSTHAHTPHESPWVVTVPLILLAIPSILSGALAIGPLLYGDFFEHGVAFERVIYIGANHLALHSMAAEFHGWAEMARHALTTLPVWLMCAGVAVAWLGYLRYPAVPSAIKARLRWFHTLFENKYYLDKLNQAVFARGAVVLGAGLSRTGERKIIDAAVNGSARLVGWFASVMRSLQSGYIYHYAFAMIVGMLALLTLFVTIGGK
ncbi:NADH-quinone oxidoreductase subunit L [Mycoavidus sp. B2-EB]|uniref:NADH-quinone oxidoreductase subunit L n=1 Tax=Mycoavidus sp. B2-EB TaxID=2651972 RepID=UPI001628E8E5|nr:NADH-quinone oxidoreductase subunit L [Mycoavidus sp. B2-EB]BBO60015.1 NADH dehydrogenase subunit L [Mycoavidus sp. B2-EB]